MKVVDYNAINLQDLVENSESIAEICRKLGLADKGGNFYTIKKKIKELKLDTGHFKHPSVGASIDKPRTSKGIKTLLIKERGHQCENCKNTVWMQKEITLELEHVDGDRTNNDHSNLLLLCPNCHALTSTWRGRQNKKHNYVEICECGKQKQGRSKTCSFCYQSRGR